MSHIQKKTAAGKVRWQARWTGPDGKPKAKTFNTKADASAHLRAVGTNVASGAPNTTLRQLAEDHSRWFDGLVKAGLREQATLDGYNTAIDNHLGADPVFAATTLAALTTPKAQAFLDALFTRTGSVSTTRKVRKALVTWCAHGQRKGLLVANPAEPTKVEATARHDADEDAVEIPPKADLAALLNAAAEGPSAPRDTALVRLLMFGGLRSSELLGLADDNLVLGRSGGEVRVRERLERRYQVLGPLKSAKGRRMVPIGPETALAVKLWRVHRGPARAFQHIDLRCTRERKAGRLFPSGDGVWGYQSFLRECWIPMLRRAGLVQMLPDARGKNRPVLAFYPHALRHVAASLWIEQGLKPKKVQELLGHSTLQLTMDLYGHLWRDAEEDAAIGSATERMIRAGTN